MEGICPARGENACFSGTCSLRGCTGGKWLYYLPGKKSNFNSGEGGGAFGCGLHYGLGLRRPGGREPLHDAEGNAAQGMYRFVAYDEVTLYVLQFYDFVAHVWLLFV